MWGPLMYADDIVLVADTGMELQTMLEVLQAYLMKWRLKFNNRKSKIMEVWREKIERVVKLMRR